MYLMYNPLLHCNNVSVFILSAMRGFLREFRFILRVFLCFLFYSIIIECGFNQTKCINIKDTNMYNLQYREHC